ncbi:MAG TPA: hypothetical protein PK589_16015, partial [Nitrospira sp.]|nr:hypothetical protein [Nitrospira sp.]HNJ21167.1 hypothetical protein [Nitrospira sp.]HNM20609.1 hypothetical protein [Nitrospira sp.]HNM62914.1 hypothetical protein [Nitrospira sp.]
KTVVLKGTVGSNPTLSAIPDPTPRFLPVGVEPAPPWNLPLCFAELSGISLRIAARRAAAPTEDRAVPFL